jgi:NADPH-dependent glutamate synthase beta subunit-like oxidoreductase
MFCLESREEMPASDDEVEEALEDGVSVNCGWGPKEILKDEKGKVKAIVFKKCISVFDEEHRFSPKYDENDTKTVECENVILSIGQAIVWAACLRALQLSLTGI